MSSLCKKHLVSKFFSLTAMKLAIMVSLIFSGVSMATADTSNGNEDVQPRPYTYGLYLSGRYANQQGDYENAAAILLEAVRRQMALEDASVNVILYQEARDALLRAGQVAGAADLLMALNVDGEQDLYSSLILSSSAALKEDWGQASQAIKRLPMNQLSKILKPFMMAWIEAGLGNKDRALSQLGITKNNFPGLYSFTKGQILDYLGEYDAAEKAYLDVEGMDSPLQLPGLTFRAYIRNLSYQEKTQEARELTSDYLKTAANSFGIEQDLKSIMEGKKLPSFAATPAMGLAETFYQMGEFFRPRGYSSISFDLNRFAEYLNPNHLNIRLSIANHLEAENRLEEAAAAFGKIKEEFPIYWQVTIDEAAVIWKMGDTDEAYEILSDLATDRPGDLQALSEQARLYSRSDDYENMSGVLTRLIRRIKQPSQQHWSYFYRQGIAMERLGDWDKAEEHFLKALELSPEEPDVLNYLGYSWVDKGQHLEKAQVMLRTAVKARRGNGAIADSLGWAYFKLEKYEDAVKLLERAVQLSPTESLIVEHLGDAYWFVGRKREANFQWNRALKWPSEEIDKDSVRAKMKNGL